MTTLRECPECHRMVKALTRGLCHTQCYKRLLRSGLNGAPPRVVRSSAECDRIAEEFIAIRVKNPGMQQKDIAAKFGMNPSTLSNLLRNRNLIPQRWNNYDSLIEDYWMLIESGETGNVESIAKRLGVSGRTLYRALKAANR